MKTLWRILLLSGFAVVLGCSSLNVKHDYDRDFDFSTVKTYDWLDQPSAVGDARAAMQRNDLLDKRIRNAVNTQLQAKGYQEVESGGDFMIVYHTGLDDKVNVTDWGYSYGPYWGYPGRDISVYNYTEGTLILDFIDNDKELIWRATATATLDPDASSEKRDKRLNDAIARMMAKFPPQ